MVIEPLESLMQKYVDGSVAAFDEIYHQTAPKLLSYLTRLTGNRGRAEDLLQITYSKVHRARASYLVGAPVLPWMLAIARRSFFDERRAAGSRPEDLSLDGSMPDSPDASGEERSALAIGIERALSEIPAAYREAIELTKITGLTMTEAAQVLDSSPSAVKIRVHRGYNLLRKQLGSSSGEAS